MPIRIATAPVSWGILEVEGWGKQRPYGEVLDEIVQAGYTGTELGPYGFLPTDPAQLKSELAQRNLLLLGAFVPSRWRTPSGTMPRCNLRSKWRGCSRRPALHSWCWRMK